MGAGHSDLSGQWNPCVSPAGQALVFLGVFRSEGVVLVSSSSGDLSSALSASVVCDPPGPGLACPSRAVLDPAGFPAASVMEEEGFRLLWVGL